MNRLVLIGNGFDCAHGLRTKYEHFIDWYWNYRFQGLIGNKTNVSKDILCTITCLKKQWTGALFFDYNLKNTYGIKLYNYLKSNEEEYKVELSPLFNRIMTSVENKGWVDIENEYYSLLVLLYSHVKDNYLNHNKQLDYLRELLIQYLNTIDYDKILKTNDEIWDKIHNGFARGSDCSVCDRNKYMKTLYSDIEDIMLLSFNYTKTPELYTIPGTTVNYIHGRLVEPNGVIFGYGDELDDDYKKLSNKNDNECLKNMKSIKYLESDNYRRMLEFIESAPFQVVIMGHSCGNSDRTLLNTIFEHRNCVSIKPYYYIKDDGTDNYLDLTMNISRNFTDMKLMRDRVVNKTYCEPLTTNKS